MEIVDMLQRQANEIARAGHYGWGNTMDDAALCISNLQRQLEEKTRLLAAYEAHPVPIAAIGNILNEVMNIAVSSGANSASMPNEYVEVAYWLSRRQFLSTEHLDALIAEAEKRGEKRRMERAAEICEETYDERDEHMERLCRPRVLDCAKAIRAVSIQEEK